MSSFSAQQLQIMKIQWMYSQLPQGNAGQVQWHSRAQARNPKGEGKHNYYWSYCSRSTCKVTMAATKEDVSPWRLPETMDGWRFPEEKKGTVSATTKKAMTWLLCQEDCEQCQHEYHRFILSSWERVDSRQQQHFGPTCFYWNMTTQHTVTFRFGRS
jgi:hypothetical protein